jgi:hypothetical protein
MHYRMDPIWQILSGAHTRLTLRGSLPRHAFYMAESAKYMTHSLVLEAGVLL